MACHPRIPQAGVAAAAPQGGLPHQRHCKRGICSEEEGGGFEPPGDDGSPLVPWRARRSPPEQITGCDEGCGTEPARSQEEEGIIVSNSVMPLGSASNGQWSA